MRRFFVFAAEKAAGRLKAKRDCLRIHSGDSLAFVFFGSVDKFFGVCFNIKAQRKLPFQSFLFRFKIIYRLTEVGETLFIFGNDIIFNVA